MKEIKQGPNKSVFMELEFLILLKCPYFLKQSRDEICIKFTMVFFTEMKNNSKIHMKLQRILNS